MPNNIDRVIKMFVKQVKELLGDRVKQILLYGSYRILIRISKAKIFIKPLTLGQNKYIIISY